MRLLDLARAAVSETRQTASNDAPSGACYRWRVNYPDGRAFDFCALPEQDRQQVQARYPGASIQQLPDNDDKSDITDQSPTPPESSGPCMEAFEERAGIMEFDGGLTRGEAERGARGPQPGRRAGTANIRGRSPPYRLNARSTLNP